MTVFFIFLNLAFTETIANATSVDIHTHFSYTSFSARTEMSGYFIGHLRHPDFFAENQQSGDLKMAKTLKKQGFYTLFYN